MEATGACRGEPWDGRGQTIVFLVASLSLCRRGFQDLLKVRPSSLLMLCGCISSSIASLMRSTRHLKHITLTSTIPRLTPTTVRGLHVGRYTPQPVSVLRSAPTLAPSFLFAQAVFEPNLFPYKYSNILKPSHSQHVAAAGPPR